MIRPDASEALETEVREELSRILSSPAFEISERNKRFLKYVVEETLEGRRDRIKAYNIATEVFGRDEAFDPQKDSIVRIEAGRLRRAIERYYLLSARDGQVQISIPKGTYVPEFFAPDRNPCPPGEPVETPHRRLHDLGPRVLVEPLEPEGDQGMYPTLARMMTRCVIAALTRFNEVFVYGFDTSEALGRSAGAPNGVAVDYRLSGTVNVQEDTIHVDLFLRRNEDSRFVWTQNVERIVPEVGSIRSLCAEIAGEVATTLALRDGILDSQARDAIGEEPSSFAGYQKLLEFQDYWRSLDPQLFQPLRRDLEITVAEDPNFALALACLSMVYSNAARYGYDVSDTTDTPLEHALDLARKAVQLAPNSSRAHHAKAIAEWFSGLVEQSLTSLQIARSLNPNDPELLAELGFRQAMRMNWDCAIPMLEAAYARNPLQTGQYRMGFFFYHFAEGRYEAALEATRAIDAPGIAQVHLASAVALSRLGRLQEARAGLERFDRLAPGILPRLREDLLLRQIHPDLVAAILDAVHRIAPDGRAGSRDVVAARILPLRSQPEICR